MNFSFFTISLFCRARGLLLFAALLAGCSGGGGGSSSVAISGEVSYERVPFDSAILNGLDFNNTQTMPARGVTVHLLDEDDLVLAVATTNANGIYRFDGVPRNTLVKIRVIAELVSVSGPVWDVKLLDHTSGNAQYVMDGALASSATDSTRNLHAASGWDNALSTYNGVRAAAPFAILDTLYSGLQRLANVDSAFSLDELEVFWSPNNNTATGSFYSGEIGATFYRNHQIYVLGQQSVDTDEYDQHVLLHEWSHFLEDSLSRSDTIGGGHNIIESLDSRLAFSEGLANALSAIFIDDPLYRNSFGVAQSEDFPIDMEDNPNPGVGDSAGWYIEGSIHSLLYDFYDADNEGLDTITTGLSPIYDVLTDSDYIDESALLTIYPFIDRFGSHSLVDNAAVLQLLAVQNISGTGSYGVGESNDGGDVITLPVYIDLVVNGANELVCTTKGLASREVNKLGNRRFVRFTTVQDDHIITVSYASGPTPSNPAFALFSRGGNSVARVPNPFNTSEYDRDEDVVSDTLNLAANDEYILEIFSRHNVDGVHATGGDFCFNVSVAR